MFGLTESFISSQSLEEWNQSAETAVSHPCGLWAEAPSMCQMPQGARANIQQGGVVCEVQAPGLSQL